MTAGSKSGKETCQLFALSMTAHLNQYSIAIDQTAQKCLSGNDCIDCYRRPCCCCLLAAGKSFVQDHLTSRVCQLEVQQLELRAQLEAAQATAAAQTAQCEALRTAAREQVCWRRGLWDLLFGAEGAGVGGSKCRCFVSRSHCADSICSGSDKEAKRRCSRYNPSAAVAVDFNIVMQRLLIEVGFMARILTVDSVAGAVWL